MTKKLEPWPELIDDLVAFPKEVRWRLGKRFCLMYPNDDWSDLKALMARWLERARQEKVIREVAYWVNHEKQMADRRL